MLATQTTSANIMKDHEHAFSGDMPKRQTRVRTPDSGSFTVTLLRALLFDVHHALAFTNCMASDKESAIKYYILNLLGVLPLRIIPRPLRLQERYNQSLI